MSKDWGHDLFFAFFLWFNSKLFEIFMKRGVHYKSLDLVLDGNVYLNFSSLFKIQNVLDFSLSVEVNSLC